MAFIRICLDDKDDIGIAVLLDGNDNLIARCLLWKGTYYDKIYANNDALVTLMKDYLHNSNYISVDDAQESICKYIFKYTR